jgi:hypothetical protein
MITPTPWTRERVIASFERPQNVERALVRLYREQTADEQASKETAHRNGVGFNANDAHWLSHRAQYVERGHRLSGWHLADTERRLRKYAQQIANLANETAAAH